MTTRLYCFVILLTLAQTAIHLSCSGNEITAEYNIVVDSDSNITVYEAAFNEKKINWNSADKNDKIVCTLSFAACELQKYLKAITGNNSSSDFQLSFRNNSVGKIIVLSAINNAYAQKAVKQIIKKENLKQKLHSDESFAIINKNEVLYIIGKERIGTLYGVYHLLETWGVRWFEPGENGEYIPKVEVNNLHVENTVINPDYLIRGFWTHENRGGDDFLLWMARNKLNLWSNAESNKPLMHKLGIKQACGGHLFWANYLSADKEYPYNHTGFLKDKNKKKDPYPVSKQYLGDKDEDGKLSFFEAHPEWYGLYDNSRQKMNSAYGVNICTSNKKAMAEFTKRLVEDITNGEYQDADIINLWPLDGGKWCQCEECSELGNPTDRMLKYIYDANNAIKKAQKQHIINREVKLYFPVYHETLSPPSKALPSNFDYHNCIAIFFPSARCYVHTIDDNSCTEYNSSIWKHFNKWVQTDHCHYKGDICIGEYFNVSRSRSLPAVFHNVISHDIPLYFNNGARYFHYMHVYTKELGPKRYNNYLLAKVLWNTKENTTVVFGDYLNKVYAQAAGKMKLFYSSLEYALSNIKQLKHYSPSLRYQINTHEQNLFPSRHFSLKKQQTINNQGVSIEESLLALKNCRTIINSLLEKDYDDAITIALAKDDQNLYYAENMYNFYFYVTQSIQAKACNSPEKARWYYRKAIPAAWALKSESDIVQSASTAANDKDGYTASEIDNEFEELGRELGINPFPKTKKNKNTIDFK